MNICNYDYRIDNNYYGELDDVKIGKSICEIESIWTDADGNINLHVDNIAFEGDILLKSLPDKEIIKVVKSVERALIRNGESNIKQKIDYLMNRL